MHVEESSSSSEEEEDGGGDDGDGKGPSACAGTIASGSRPAAARKLYQDDSDGEVEFG